MKTLFLIFLFKLFVLPNVLMADSYSRNVPMGTLKLKGLPGIGQGSQFSVYFIGLSPIGKKHASGPVKTFSLNTSISLKEGFYFLHYEFSSQVVEIKSGQKNHIFLKKIPINYQDQVYLDLTHPEEQKKTLQKFWNYSQASGSQALVSFCEKYKDIESKEAKNYCSLVTSKNFKDYSKLIRFTKKGGWELMTLSCDQSDRCEKSWFSYGAPFVCHGKNNDQVFVSVLSEGVYKIRKKAHTPCPF